ATLPIGASKFGGLPDLPPEYISPEHNGKPLGFLAQFRLEELADCLATRTPAPLQLAFDMEVPEAKIVRPVAQILPSSVWLYFFYSAIANSGGYEPEDRGSWKVFYYDGEVSDLKRTAAPSTLEPNSFRGGCSLDFRLLYNLPTCNSCHIAWDDYFFEGDERECYEAMLEILEERQGR